ncbi:MAG: hypothetical protein JOY77_12250 [Alphaproteobacteria bacterium]|nr:hypothetical protein [Alphaproteobacteria bacterium]MBV9063682.1 hypothetical protein [Alphaproteobacteria bacterium]
MGLKECALLVGLSLSLDQPAAAESAASSKVLATRDSAVVKAIPALAKPEHIGVPQSGWLDGLAGRRMVAVDGSTLVLTATEDGVLRETAVPGAAPLRAHLSFLNNRQGTVSDGTDEHVVGVFRLTRAGLVIDYADDTAESWTGIADGGVAVNQTSGDSALCTAWYPEGHNFSMADRQRALAAYASRLGVSYTPPAGSSGCPGRPTVADQPGPTKLGSGDRKPTAAPLLPIPSTVLKQAALDGTQLRPAEPILVRTAAVRPIDDPALAAEGIAEAPAVWRANVKEDVQSPSGCLSVEADGASWGFRNRCNYPVAFAYCVNDMTGTENSCNAGAVSGSVPPNSFGALFASKSIKDSEHDFRWIGCKGEDGRVTARLVRSDPPAGQCLRVRS